MTNITILHSVKKHGQQIWLDNLSRHLIQSGSLKEQLEEGICGVTSNPAIFYQAFLKDVLYQADIKALKAQNLSPQERYEKLALADVQAACDVFAPLFKASKGKEGFVSLEVSPFWAYDTLATIIEARRLWQKVGRPNVMIKIPATDAGLAAMRTLVAEGMNINLTLLFSRQQAQKAYVAYVEGLNLRLEQNLAVDSIYVVASFFLSRVDTALDECLPVSMRGQAAIALAKMAYVDWQAFFKGAAFASLSEQGAAAVSLLWASTGTKNSAYADVLYVESLIGPQTVNTVPAATLAAFVDHGQAQLTLSKNSEQARLLLEDIMALGVDFEALATRLQQDGLLLFEEAFEKLLGLL